MNALYQKQILEFAKLSRTRELDPAAPYQASSDNPTCGDRVDVSLQLDNGAISHIGIKVRGCALCEAGAGLLIENFVGITPDDASRMTAQFSRWIGKELDEPPNEDMAKFMPVRDIRNRHKCVLLAFQAANEALAQP